MTLWHLVTREIFYRKGNFALAVVSVMVAIGSLVGALGLLAVHDLSTEQTLCGMQTQVREQMDRLKDDMRKATLRLGLNLAILPKEQSLGDWYADDYGTRYMPAEYVDKLAGSGVLTVQHFLPILQQKVTWPETKRTVILVGTKGEVPTLPKASHDPLVQPVPDGAMVVGFELAESLGLDVGDKVTFMGGDFVVHRCHEERGTKDDITVWIPLRTAQGLLGKEGLINAILALHCLCVGRDLSTMRQEVASVLPDVQVIELGTEKALARFEARAKAAESAKAELDSAEKLRLDIRARLKLFTLVLVVIVLTACGVWVGFLAFGNVRQRRFEIGILRALGFRTGQILFLFLSRSLVVGLLGGLLGFAVGSFTGGFLGVLVEGLDLALLPSGVLFSPMRFVLVLALGPFVSALASWIPSVLAAGCDPAGILSQE